MPYKVRKAGKETILFHNSFQIVKSFYISHELKTLGVAEGDSHPTLYKELKLSLDENKRERLYITIGILFSLDLGNQGSGPCTNT